MDEPQKHFKWKPVTKDHRRFHLYEKSRIDKSIEIETDEFQSGGGGGEK